MPTVTADRCLDADISAAFVAGALAEGQRADVERHMDGCADCRRHISELARLGDSAEVATPERVGRYVIAGRIGEGGMGVVYRAHDPELDRSIALKMVRAARAGSVLEARLAREAKAMARLSHRNVVAIYDVVTEGERVFIAMELIEGSSLAKWRTKTARTDAEILRAFVEAGQGLRAAHAAGLVHRDFKPDNVLVEDASGRVCVTDFGLAIDDAAPALLSPGTLIGTPAYMAPEQHRGERADARSDQFSFCVALYESLCGESPFAGDTVATRAEAVQRGTRRPPPKKRLGARVARALDRGMKVARDARWPSMDALLRELEPRKKPLWLAALPLVALVPLFFALRGPRPAPCPSAAARLEGVWDGAKKASIEKAFVATGKPYAHDAWRGTERALDAYAKEWSAAYPPTCATQDAAELRRSACLEDRLLDLRGLVDVLEHATGELVPQAVAGAEALPRVAQCKSGGALAIRTPPPTDPVVVAKVLGVRAKLGRIRALADLQAWKDALPLTAGLVEEARATGYKPLIARTLFTVGTLEASPVGTRANARALFTEAATIADSIGDDRTRASALLGMVSEDLGAESGPAKERNDQAFAAAERVTDDDEVQYFAQLVLATNIMSRGKFAEGEAPLRKAVAAADRAYGEGSWRAAMALCLIGGGLGEQGKPEEALAVEERALYIIQRAMGPEAPPATWPHLVSALQLNELLRPADAEAHLREALRIAERENGPTSYVTADILDELGKTMLERGRWDEATALFARSAPLQGTRASEDSINGLLGLGQAELGRHAYAKAIAFLERAVAIPYHGANDVTHAEAELALAEALLGAKKPGARAHLLHARDVYRAAGRGPRRSRDLARIEALLAK